MKPGTMKPGGIAGIVILVVAVVAVAAAVVVRKYNTRKEVDSGDSNASPYATSRTNWASQEPEMETPIEDFAAKDVDDSEDKPGPQLV
jgi:hypothetical protein